MSDEKVEQIWRLLAECTLEVRRAVFARLRDEFPLHPLESQLNTTAEMILEAIARSGDLTLRGVRGVIAEAAFIEYVVRPAEAAGWRDVTESGDFPYDFKLEDAGGPVRIQVKMQRLERGAPKLWKKGHGFPEGPVYVVETQRTRGGRNPDGTATRPYRFGEFDVLAVSLHPSTNDWSAFRYTVADWLVPRLGGRESHKRPATSFRASL
ncbi:MAG: hypothetical protein ACOZDY_20105 [Pseudomonadota bacterium]